jgi:hypothetical protein
MGAHFGITGVGDGPPELTPTSIVAPEALLMNWTPTIFSIASSLGIAVVTSLVSVRLALRRFYSEKWWERKSASYIAIIESLHHLREHADTHLTFEMKDLKLPTEGAELLERNLKQAMADLRKHRDIGSFVISEEAMSILNSLFAELDKSVEIGRLKSYVEYLDYRVGAIDETLGQLRGVAKRDLSME